MKKYRLKKDFVFSKADEEFEIFCVGDGNVALYKDGIELYYFFVGTAEDIDDFIDEIFEEVEEAKDETL